MGAFEEGDHVLAVDLRFLRVHADEEVVGFEGLEFGDSVVERDKVIGEDVVGVFLEDFGGKLPGLLFLAQAQQVFAELGLGREDNRARIRGLAGTIGIAPSAKR